MDINRAKWILYLVTEIVVFLKFNPDYPVTGNVCKRPHVCGIKRKK